MSNETSTGSSPPGSPRRRLVNRALPAPIAQRLSGAGPRAELARGTGAAFAIRVLGLAVAFATHVLIARLIGDAGYGVYALGLAVAMIAGQVAHLGLPNATLRFIPQYQSQKQPALLRGYLQRSTQMGLIAGLATGAMLLIAAWGLSSVLSTPMTRALVAAALFVPAFGLLQIWRHRLRALRRVVSALWPAFVGRYVLLAMGLAMAVAWLGRPMGGAGVLGLEAGALVILSLLVYAMARRRLTPSNASNTGAADKAGSGASSVAQASGLSTLTSSADSAGQSHPPRAYATRQWLAAAVMMLLSGLFVIALQRIDVLMLGALIDAPRAGIYNAAVRIAMFAGFGFQALNTLLAPMIAEQHHAGEHRALQRLLRFASLGLMATTLPLALGLAALHAPLLGLFGERFTAGGPALLILLLNHLVNAMGGSVGMLLTMSGRERRHTVILLAGVGLNVALNWLLIPALGMSGAALASLAATAMLNLAMGLAAWRQLRLNPTVLCLFAGRQ